MNLDRYFGRLFAPETGGPSPPADPVASQPAISAPEPAPAPQALAADAPAAASAPSPAAGVEGAPDKPTHEFSPSFLDEAAKAAEPPAKPADKAGEPAKDAKPEGDKPVGAEAKPEAPGEAPSAPNYAFTYPEGIKPEDLNTERMTAYTGILGEAKIAPEVGQKLLDLHLSELQSAAERIATQQTDRQWAVFNEMQTAWKSTNMADPELGGSRHATAQKEIMSFVDQFGGGAEERKGLMEELRITGAANSPHLLRMLRRAGEALSREPAPRPAPAPRVPQASGRDRSLARYSQTARPNGQA